MPVSPYLPPPAGCERLAAIVTRSRGSMNVLTEEDVTEYALPHYGRSELLDFWKPLSSVRTGAIFIARLPGGRVFGAGAVLSPDGRSIARDVSADFGKGFHEHWLLTYPKIRSPTLVRGPVAVVASTMGSGYSHWLLEELPRLLLLGVNEIPTIIGHSRQPFSRAAWQHSGHVGKIVEPRRDTQLVCEELVVPSLIGEPGFPTPLTLELIHSFAETIPARPVSHGPRIYVSRSRAKRRRVTNEDALCDALATRGFVRVCLEDLSWAEQIALFRQVQTVVAPHGAGLANLLFCKPETRVVEFFNRSYLNGCYWRVSALRGLDYRPVVSAGPDPLGDSLPANRHDIAADIPGILEALD